MRRLVSAGMPEMNPYQATKNFIFAAIFAANPARFEYHSPTRATHVLYESSQGRSESFRLVQRFVQGVSVEKQY